MKRLLAALLMFVSAAHVSAQTKLDDLSEIAPREFACVEVYAFKETSQACYVKARRKGWPKEDFEYMLITPEMADTITMFTSTPEGKRPIRQLATYKEWLRAFLDGSGVNKTDGTTRWTYFKPKKRVKDWRSLQKEIQPFDMATAFDTYFATRGMNPDGTRKRQMTAKEERFYLSVAKTVLEAMSGTETPLERMLMGKPAY